MIPLTNEDFFMCNLSGVRVFSSSSNTPSWTESQILNKAGFLESLVSSALVDSLDSFCRKSESDGFLELRNVDALFLEVWVLALCTSRVELGSTGPVGVASCHH